MEYGQGGEVLSCTEVRAFQFPKCEFVVLLFGILQAAESSRYRIP